MLKVYDIYGYDGFGTQVSYVPKGYTNLVHFYDDGISGVTMDRPGFVSMLQEIEKGKAAAVFVKDDCVILELNTESP